MIGLYYFYAINQYNLRFLDHFENKCGAGKECNIKYRNNNIT